MNGSNQQQHQNVEVYQEVYSSVYPPQAQQQQPQPYYYQQPQMMMYPPPQQPQQQPQYITYPHQQQPQQMITTTTTTTNEIVLQEQVQKLTQTLQATMWQSTQYQEQLEALEAKLAEAEQSAASAEGNLEMFKRSVELETRALHQELAGTKSRLASVEKLYGDLRQRHLTTLEQIAQAEEQSEGQERAVQDSLVQLRQENAALHDARASDANELAERDEQLRSLQAQLRQLQDRLEEQAATTADLAERLDDEFTRALSEIAAAAKRFSDSSAQAVNVHHVAIRDAVNLLLGSISELIRKASVVQTTVVEAGRASGIDPSDFYMQHSVWGEGLISAAKAVASATLWMLEKAEGALAGTASLEELVVGSQQVSAAVAQLIAAARVKSDRDSPEQQELEQAARSVTELHHSVVDAASLSAASISSDFNLQTPSDPHARKVAEMEAQVRIKSLEAELERARNVLSYTRRQGYSQN